MEAVRRTLYAGTRPMADAREIENARANLRRALEDSGVAGATILETLGIWRGESEHGFRVEVIGAPDDDSRALRAAAAAYARLERQSEVWIAADRVQLEIVAGSPQAGPQDD